MCMSLTIRVWSPLLNTWHHCVVKPYSSVDMYVSSESQWQGLCDMHVVIFSSNQRPWLQIVWVSLFVLPVGCRWSGCETHVSLVIQQGWSNDKKQIMHVTQDTEWSTMNLRVTNVTRVHPETLFLILLSERVCHKHQYTWNDTDWYETPAHVRCSCEAYSSSEMLL
jgi:hypothetical protein